MKPLLHALVYLCPALTACTLGPDPGLDVAPAVADWKKPISDYEVRYNLEIIDLTIPYHDGHFYGSVNDGVMTWKRGAAIDGKRELTIDTLAYRLDLSGDVPEEIELRIRKDGISSVSDMRPAFAIYGPTDDGSGYSDTPLSLPIVFNDPWNEGATAETELSYFKGATLYSKTGGIDFEALSMEHNVIFVSGSPFPDEITKQSYLIVPIKLFDVGVNYKGEGDYWYSLDIELSP